MLPIVFFLGFNICDSEEWRRVVFGMGGAAYNEIELFANYGQLTHTEAINAFGWKVEETCCRGFDHDRSQSYFDHDSAWCG